LAGNAIAPMCIHDDSFTGSFQENFHGYWRKRKCSDPLGYLDAVELSYHEALYDLASLGGFDSVASLAQTSEREEPPVEIKDLYQVDASSALVTSAPVQTPAAPPSAVKTSPSMQVPVDSKHSRGATPVRGLPPSSGADAFQASTGNESPAREGFYLRLAYGPGIATFRGQGPNGAASISGLSSSTTIAIGGSLTRGLVLAGTLQSTQTTARFNGGPFAAASITNDGSTLSATNRASASLSEIGAIVDWYPMPRYGLHSGLMAGLAMVSVTNLADNSSLRGAKLAASVFIGYDWSISRYWAMGLELLGSGGPKASLRAGRSRVDSGYELAPMALGIAATIVYF
jgi:hypothetical protein